MPGGRPRPHEHSATRCGDVRLPLAATPHLPTTSSTAAPTTTTRAAAPAVKIQPLPVRPVQKSQPTSPNKCPATNPSAPRAPANVLVTCDLARTTLYTLGPETTRLALTHVDPPTSLSSGFYEVSLTMDPSSAAAKPPAQPG